MSQRQGTRTYVGLSRTRYPRGPSLAATTHPCPHGMAPARTHEARATEPTPAHQLPPRTNRAPHMKHRRARAALATIVIRAVDAQAKAHAVAGRETHTRHRKQRRGRARSSRTCSSDSTHPQPPPPNSPAQSWSQVRHTPSRNADRSPASGESTTPPHPPHAHICAMWPLCAADQTDA